jgi:uncharacterized membrane protein
MTDWYFARAGVQHGPMSFEQLAKVAADGGLDPANDLVWNETMTGWTPAAQVPGLFVASVLPYSPDAATVTAGPEVAENFGSATANPYSPPQSRWLEPAAVVAAPALAEIVPGSDPLDPTACVSRGFELTKRYYLSILLVGLVYFGCYFGVSIAMSLIQMAITFAAAHGGTTDAGAMPDGVGFAVMGTSIVLQLILQVFVFLMQLGLIRVGLNLVSGKPVQIGQLFGETPKLLRAIGATILYSIALMIGILLLIVPGVYLALRYGQYLKGIVDRDLGIMESFEYSSSITTNNRGNLFVLWLLLLLLSLLILVTCGLAIFFIGPMLWLITLIAYRWMQYGRLAVADHPGTQEPVLSGT